MTDDKWVLSDGTVSGSDVRVTRDAPGYLPRAGQGRPALACNTATGTSLVVWHDQGRKSSATTKWGIWGRIWATTWQIYLSVVTRGY
jgi:hypothetical protein